MPRATPCDACAIRRVKCDTGNPCSWCDKHQQPCTYLRARRRRGPKGPRASTTVKIAEQQIRTSLTPASAPALATENSTSSGYSGRIPPAQYITYLDLYHSKLYAIWPVVAIQELKSQLCNDTCVDPEVHALAAALCAATILQLRLTDEDIGNASASVTSGVFVRECLRHRHTLTYANTISTKLLLISLLLHMYYANTGQIHLATFALRDAITYVHLLHLDNEETLESLPVEEREVGIRIFWVLFVTERTFCASHGIPMLLQQIPFLPDPRQELNDGTCSIAGFCCLVRLFTLGESLLPRQPTAIKQLPGSPGAKGELQMLYQDIDTSDADRDSTVLLQEIDIRTTRAWLQSLLWQRALSNFLLDSHASEIQFTPEFPLTLAKGLLRFLSKVPIDLIRPHAYAMEVKLCQVAHTLLDIIMIVPSVRRSRCLQFGPIDVVLGFEKLLRSLFRHESEPVTVMRRRLEEIEVGPFSLSSLRPLYYKEKVHDWEECNALPLQENPGEAAQSRE
ncbi:hypothetical protein BDV12DRAFT_205539 [Aspergillus spectabilis]